MNKQEDIKAMQRFLRRTIKRNYRVSLSQGVSETFGDISLFFIICLAIIFRPINLIIAGIVLIIALLI